ncbi:MAG: protease modulator HflC [Gammaproteobacteria bacterium]|nr:protease modulator HflC [Gammaproteobacteria bacterium]
MSQGKILALVALLLVITLTAASAIYTVDERQRVIVVRLGQVLRHDDVPGLHFKMPFLDKTRYFDSRILTLDFDPQQVLTIEKKYVLVDSFVKWRIVDPLKFYVTAEGSEAGARSRLRPIMESGLIDEFGKRTLQGAVSADRSGIMEDLRQKADKAARDLGLEVVDVRVQRVDLPEKVSVSVYERMRAERARIAFEYRAKGAEEAEKIRADAERQREVLLADAYRNAETMRGEGEGRATTIYADAYGRSPEFFSLYRSLNAYKESFRKKDDVLIVDPSSDFFRYMKKPTR